MNAQYEGTSAGATAPAACRPGRSGLGNREAYFIAMENTANPTQHSVIKGKAPAGAVLRLHKVFETPTSIVDENLAPKTFTDVLDSNMVVPASGTFTWHINPSTSPLSVRDRGRPAHGTPSAAISFTGSPAGAGVPPAVGDPAAPCGVVDDEDPNCYNDHPFTVAGGTGVDNDQASIQLSWATPASDWDVRVYRDTNGDGKSAGESVLANSEQGTTSSEATSIVQPDLTPGNYVIRVINYAADEPYNGTVTFYGPQPFVPAHQESYTLTCERPAGVLRSATQLFIDRGQVKTLKGLCK